MEAPAPTSSLISAAARAETTRELAQLLRQLRRRDARLRGEAELTYRELACRCGWSLGIVGEYFLGNVLPPTDRFDVLIQQLGATREEQKALATARDRVEERRRPAEGRTVVTPDTSTAPVPHQLPAGPRNFTGRAADLARLDNLLGGALPTIAPPSAPGLDGASSNVPSLGIASVAGASSEPGSLAGLLPRHARSDKGDTAVSQHALPDGAHGDDHIAHLPIASAPAPVIAAVSGIPGVGKTALALAWAHRVKHQFPDGQLYVNLRGYDRDPPAAADEVLDGFLHTLRVPTDQIPRTVDGRAALFRSLLDGRRMLVLLDNARDAEQVRPLLPGSSSCFVIVTSRTRLTGLAVSVGSIDIDLQVLTDDDAVRLLCGLIGQRRAAAEPAALQRVVELCGGLPLALQLLGQRAATHPDHRISDLAAEIAAEAQPLDALSVGPDEFTAVRSVFSWSYRCLPPDQARSFRLLGLHPGSEFSTWAAAAIEDLSPVQTRPVLERLADAHLIEYVCQDRYRFHDLVRAYARERAEIDSSQQERDSALARLVGFYLHTAAAADRLLHPGRYQPEVDAVPKPPQVMPLSGYTKALAWCEAERANLTAITRAAADTVPAAAWQIPNCLWSFFYIRKYWTDWITTCEIGLDAAIRSADLAGQARMLNGLGSAYRDLHLFAKAIECYRRTLALARRLSHRLYQGSALSNLGDLFLALGQYEAALDHSRQAMEVLEGLDSPYHESIALGNLSEAYLGLHRYDLALEGFQAVLVKCQEIRHRYGEGLTLIHLGEAYLGLRQYESAVNHLTKALELCGDIGDTHGQGMAWRILGEVFEAAGRPAMARQAWETAARIFEALGSPELEKIRRYLRQSHNNRSGTARPIRAQPISSPGGYADKSTSA